MKVAQVLYSGLGGHGSVAFSLASSAGSHWQASMLFAGVEPLLPEYARLCDQKGVRRAHIQMREGKTWWSWPSVIAELGRAHPQVIVLHSVKLILPCWLYARRRGIPLIAVEHQPNSLKTKSEWVVSHLLMRLANAVVVLTPEYHTALKRRLGLAFRPDKVHVIPNGIDTTAFRPGEKRTLHGQPVRVGMAARFSNTKRQDLLIHALALLLRDEGPDSWRLSLAGDGERLGSMRRAAEDSGIGDMVEFPGYLGDAELRNWFSQLDFYAHASAGETLSTSLLQAMAMGLPIVGSSVAGITNLLAAEEGCGRLSTSNTAQAFASELRAMIADPEETAAMAHRARTLAETRYSQDAMFQAYSRLIASFSA